ncbi:PREDICTED: olfactory receptor 6C70-like [Myotis davidii]|uniref:olfactory receptor 6C70-like n=1 Tax=Myotis davidii TaxID=225400 RepID=UPI000767CCF3|nr:PREDICTED: olfactory receptor 6C70-like [Myotis davidii]
MENHTVQIEFILLGLTDNSQLQIVIFFFLFLNYMLSMIGNLTIIALCLQDSHLMTPMYFFLRSFSFLEILKFPSAHQKKKAFSTCSSHMIVITITYGSCIFIYMKPSANERTSLSKGVAVLHTSVSPLLNPFIYTLRNQQVKQAFRDVFRKVLPALDK